MGGLALAFDEGIARDEQDGRCGVERGVDRDQRMCGKERREQVALP
jgi:hypothetical protein